MNTSDGDCVLLATIDDRRADTRQCEPVRVDDDRPGTDARELDRLRSVAVVHRFSKRSAPAIECVVISVRGNCERHSDKRQTDVLQFALPSSSFYARSTPASIRINAQERNRRHNPLLLLARSERAYCKQRLL